MCAGLAFMDHALYRSVVPRKRNNVTVHCSCGEVVFEIIYYMSSGALNLTNKLTLCYEGGQSV